ncbi:MAG: YihY family inner membrane protein, partial [Thermoanaerobaculia bacterium]
MPENLRRVLIRSWHFVQALWKQFKQDKVLIRASGLAYSTLLAIVPLAAVLFALFSAFGALDDLKREVQEVLVAQFLPTRQDELNAILNDFIENADKFGIVGFAFLAITALFLLDAIESNFNDIWHVRRRRRYLSKITAYTSVLVLGSLFLGASLSVSARIQALLFSGTILDRSLIRRTLDWSVPLALTLLGFLLLYLIVPYTRVKWRSALFGALLAGIGWEVAKNVFADSVGQSARYSILYGSLAVIPIFLVWLYVTWVIVLVGLLIAYTHQHFDFLEKDLCLGDGPQEGRLSLTLKIYALIAHQFHDGGE